MSSIEASYILKCPPEMAYAHWISPKTIIPPATSLEIQAKVGGIYKLGMPGGVSMMGKFVLVEPNQRLVYSWQWQGDSEITKVDVMFSAHSSGAEIKIVHGDFTTVQSFERHSDGWNNYIEGLGEYLSKVTQ
jgi:uncharacterized protein YndB with AHSA1/START domain